MNDKFFLLLREKIQPYFEKIGGHDFTHTEGVYNLAIEIAKTEKADLDVVMASALLHDISRKKEEEGKCECHAEDGAKIAGKILAELKFPEDKIEKVVHSIAAHRYSGQIKAETREAEILQDADRLDALGAVIIARVFAQAGKRNMPFYDPKIEPKKKYNGKNTTAINHFYEKILKINPETFKTEKAKEIAKDRFNFDQEFVRRFVKEWNSDIT